MPETYWGKMPPTRHLIEESTGALLHPAMLPLIKVSAE